MMYKMIFIPVNVLNNLFTTFGEYIILMSQIFQSPKEWKDYINLT
jgi:hypothetical protein